jgi:hypothetical protein
MRANVFMLFVGVALAVDTMDVVQKHIFEEHAVLPPAPVTPATP